MTFRLGVDIGGTFTDAVILQENILYRGKADTTHYDLQVGFMNATRAAAGEAGLELKDLLRNAESIVYSTTIGTNALIERRGSHLGLITTKGFEDTVFVGRSRNWADGMPPEKKHDRSRAQRPKPLIPYQRIVGVQERVDNLGNVIVPLRDSDVEQQIAKLVNEGVRGFVVVLLNSFAYPAHEHRIRELIYEQFPESYVGHMPVYLSSEIAPYVGEYRRSMTVIIDAYLRELTEEHLLRLNMDLREAGYQRPLFIAKNTGGISSLSRAQPIHLLGSSPSASIIGAEQIGKVSGGISNIIVADMGGTSFDVGLVVSGRDRIYEHDSIIDRFRVHLPYIAHWSIGAGGGSIAWLNDGELRVGPHSAGSNPGPACYGRGGVMPTVTDADVLLGYIDPDSFCNGRVKLDVRRTCDAIKREIADPLGVDTVEAAWNIKQLIDGIMGQELYRICAQISGYDPREFVAFALGGAGPVHAAGFAHAADVRRVATFQFSSVFGAFSTLALDILQTYEKSVSIILYKSSTGGYIGQAAHLITNELQKLSVLALRDMDEEGLSADGIELQASVFLSYGQQRQSLQVALDPSALHGDVDIRGLCERFNSAYSSRFGPGSTHPEAGIDLVKIRLSAVGSVKKYEGRRETNCHSARPIPGRRRAYWGPDFGWIDTPVYSREMLSAAGKLVGPVLCDASDTVIVVPPNWELLLDEHGIAWIEMR